jgi:thioredoxin-like negative regulator of GroEL
MVAAYGLGKETATVNAQAGAASEVSPRVEEEARHAAACFIAQRRREAVRLLLSHMLQIDPDAPRLRALQALVQAQDGDSELAEMTVRRLLGSGLLDAADEPALLDMLIEIAAGRILIEAVYERLVARLTDPDQQTLWRIKLAEHLISSGEVEAALERISDVQTERVAPPLATRVQWLRRLKRSERIAWIGRRF